MCYGSYCLFEAPGSGECRIYTRHYQDIRDEFGLSACEIGGAKFLEGDLKTPKKTADELAAIQSLIKERKWFW